MNTINNRIWQRLIQDLTWTCHICSKERPDAKISVEQKDISEKAKMSYGSIKINIRYCNDNDTCKASAEYMTYEKFLGTEK